MPATIIWQCFAFLNWTSASLREMLMMKNLSKTLSAESPDFWVLTLLKILPDSYILRISADCWVWDFSFWPQLTLLFIFNRGSAISQTYHSLSDCFQNKKAHTGGFWPTMPKDGSVLTDEKRMANLCRLCLKAWRPARIISLKYDLQIIGDMSYKCFLSKLLHN